MKLPIYGQSGPVAELTVPEVIVEEPARLRTVYQKVVAELANARRAVAHTKTRGAVRGGGRKPWRQKGTGRARHGSIRSPIWVGGGITFGPLKERTFTKSMPRQMRQKALRSVLAFKIQHSALLVFEDWTGISKTKELVSRLKMVGQSLAPILLILEAPRAEMIFAARNIPGMVIATTGSVRVRQLLTAKTIVTSRQGFTDLVKRVFDLEVSAGLPSKPTKSTTKQTLRRAKKSAP